METESTNTNSKPEQKGHRNAKPRTRQEQKCFFCLAIEKTEEEATGHISRDCLIRRNYTCQKCKKTGHLEDRCLSKPCFYCKEHGHQVNYCPKVLEHECRKCKQSGHLERRCENYCDYCRSASGHTIDNCPDKKCNYCGEFGHLRGRDCPMSIYDYRYR